MEHLPYRMKWGVALALIGVGGAADWLTGEEISLSIFYLIPVGWAAWLISRSAGLIMAALAAVVWLAVERANHAGFSHPLIPLWNAVVRFGFFALGVGFVSLLRHTEERLMGEVSRRTRRLRIEARRRRTLEREILELSAREQAQLSQKIHDELGQYISALAYHVKMVAEDLLVERSRHVVKVDRVMELIRATNQAIRRLGRAMHVPDDSEGALVESLQELGDEFERLTGVACRVNATSRALALDGFRSLMLYRIVQEACSNAVKHGSPTTIVIQVSVREATLLVSISDDGRGSALSGGTHEGMGVRVMKHRAELMGGCVELYLGEKGCTVECRVPLAAR